MLPNTPNKVPSSPLTSLDTEDPPAPVAGSSEDDAAALVALIGRMAEQGVQYIARAVSENERAKYGAD